MNTLDAGIMTADEDQLAIDYINDQCAMNFSLSTTNARCFIVFYSLKVRSPFMKDLEYFISVFKSAPWVYPENVVMSISDDNSGIEEIIRPNGY